MSDYKDTLNLPHTDFPMKASLAQREPGMLANWQELDLYKRIAEKNAGKPKFILHDGPPYANGELHLGHAINKSLKDFVVKAKSLNGFDAPYIPGWDCHGLPIEHNVEKKKGKAGQKISHADFRTACREYAAKQVEIQKKGFIRLGVLGDWDNPYLTMNFNNEADIVRSLGKIVANGHLVKGYKPVYWSVVGASALAEAEVEYQDKTSFAIDVRFAANDAQSLLSIFGVDASSDSLSVVIWTTTPWTLPSNQAVCLHAELQYALVRCDLENGSELLILAKDMVGTIMARYKCENYEILAEVSGEALENQQLQHPFVERNVPVILGEHVTTEAGTGAVHTAPDHGVDDFNVGKNYGLGTLNLVDENGVFTSAAGDFAGGHVYKVDEDVIEKLKENQALVAVEKITHSYAHCWRTKTPLIYRATPQWFISMSEKDLLGSALDAVQDINWLPDWGKARMELMLKGSPDWCVSRQRTWGVPITLFVNKESQELHPDMPALIEQVAQRIEKEGIEAWFQLEPEELLGDDASLYEKVTDTLDVWFDSGVSHYSVMSKRDELSYPADLYLEGSDQHRGWFQSSLKTAIAMNGTAPYKEVLTHGFFVDAEGRKMSKSIGNTVAPEKIFQQYGADILRLWVAATDIRGEMTVSDEIFKRVADSYRRIRNTSRFMLSNLSGFDPATDLLAPDDMIALDYWITRQCQLLQKEVIGHYENYNFLNVYQKIHNFCVIELGGFYLDVIKDRQYTCQSDSVARRSTQTALYHILEMFSRLIAPILSFTGDEIWKSIPGERAESVFLSNFSESEAEYPESAELNDAFWQKLMAVKTAVNKELEAKRAEKSVGASLSAEVDLYCDSQTAEILNRLGSELRFVLIVSRVGVSPLEEAPATAIASEADGLKIVVKASDHEKCERCWHHREDVGSDAKHPELCQRCVENIEGEGEYRSFA
ncbi:MAG: isoleucine--tRNA ligase [Gammaproteobacteria bacterium]|jgi:isoleucyl-tRNA synthetase|nr:isoleucine--tRNA ligase [Gammaproteobacteria bacterium]MBT3860015.1 isoleucine--tRNA ligase [Gammaproteobacteria bacterium]MBT3987035.1 isoleucine--tRNA ligase [Gammaproteobacteria bacterium]MBT4580700.1 isoleucine--tRNA ligase [Gammaproteobacteria bacterium]MBT4658635.1 isoleucine--tRNA ligase [Gammaproteobacteria bacterium]